MSIDSLDLTDFPLLSSLMRSPVGPDLERELTRLLASRRPRAPRRATNTVARIQSGGRTHHVVIQNISDSGLTVALSRRTAPSLDELASTELFIRTDVGMLTLHAALVRVVHTGNEQITVALRFVDITSQQMFALGQLTHLLVSDLFQVRPVVGQV